MEIKYWVVQQTSNAQLAVFTQTDWQTSAKEVHFTGPLQKASLLEAEASSQGCSDVLKRLQVLKNTLQASKDFLSKLRSLDKAKSKLPRYAALAKHASIVQEYLLKQNMTAAHSFEMVVARSVFISSLTAAFQEQVVAPPSMSDAVVTLVGSKLPAALAEHSDDERGANRAFDPDLCIRSLLADGL